MSELYVAKRVAQTYCCNQAIIRRILLEILPPKLKGLVNLSVKPRKLLHSPLGVDEITAN